MASPAADNIALIKALTELPSMVSGKSAKTVTSGGTQTTQTQMSPEAMQTLMRHAMESSSGLAAIAGGQKVPGLYNSTTRQLLVNDLLTRSAGEIAKASAPTVTTQSPRTVQMIQPKANQNISMLGLAAAGLMSDKGRKLLGKGVDWLNEDERDVSVDEFVGSSQMDASGPDYGVSSAMDYADTGSLSFADSAAGAASDSFQTGANDWTDLIGVGMDNGGSDVLADAIDSFSGSSSDAYKDILDEAASFFEWD